MKNVNVIAKMQAAAARCCIDNWEVSGDTDYLKMAIAQLKAAIVSLEPDNDDC